MSILLYKKGTTHNINGIDCDIKKVDPELFTGQPEPGWYLQPEEIAMGCVKSKPKKKTTKPKKK